MELTTALELRNRNYGTKTYKVSDDKIEGFIDDLEALRQTVYKILSTEQFEHLIYSFNYGTAWKDLIGEERPYVRAEMKRMVREALLRDDRILEVDGFDFRFFGDTCQCSFNVSSIYGETRIETEVSV